MSLQSSRLLIANGLQAFLAGIQNPNTSANLYGLSKLGAVFDPTPYTSWIEIVDPRGKSGPAGSGGNQIGWLIKDEITFKLTSGWDYEADSTAAMVNMFTAQDILLPTLHSHYQIPNPNMPTQAIASVYSVLEDPVDWSQPVKFPNGKVYLLWHAFAVVKQQYSVTIVNP